MQDIFTWLPRVREIFFFQGPGKIREFCSWSREIEISEKGRENRSCSGRIRIYVSFYGENMVMAVFYYKQSQMLMPYLEKYQTVKPLVIFMAQDIDNLLRTILAKFMKPKTLDDADTSIKLTKIEVHVGFVVKGHLQKLEQDKQVSALQVLEFYSECRTFLQCIIGKLFERCQLKYPVARYLSSLDPKFMVLHREQASATFQNLLGKLRSCTRLTANECDIVKHQFETLLVEVQKYHKEEFKSYSVTQTIDTFYHDLLGGGKRI